MAKFYRVRALLIGCLLLLVAPALIPVKRVTAVAPRARRFQFEYKATVKEIQPGAKKVDLWMPVPHDSDVQKITELQISSPVPYRLYTAAYGNRMLHISLNNPPPTSFTVTMQFNAIRKEHVQEMLQTASRPALNEKADPNMARWLSPDHLVPIDGNIREWARKVVDDAGARSDLEKARAIYNHVVATVKYDKSGTGWGRGDIYYACDARRGNCTDFHAIFIGYCRAVGIPARFAIGFPLPADRGAGQVSGYHCWAEFYAKGIGWVPVDASEAAKNPAKREYFFGAHDESRIEFSQGRDLTLEPKQHGEPLNYFIYPYVEIDGKSSSSLEKSFAYHDLPETAATSGG